MSTGHRVGGRRIGRHACAVRLPGPGVAAEQAAPSFSGLFRAHPVSPPPLCPFSGLPREPLFMERLRCNFFVFSKQSISFVFVISNNFVPGAAQSSHLPCLAVGLVAPSGGPPSVPVPPRVSGDSAGALPSAGLAGPRPCAGSRPCVAPQVTVRPESQRGSACAQ